jgi:hypothetical protein
MDLDKILSLLNAEQLPQEIRGEVRELINILIEAPDNNGALARLLFLIGANKLDPDTQKTISENVMSLVDMAAKELLESIGAGEFGRRKIKRLYVTKINENISDPDIARLSKQIPKKKSEYRWDHGFGSDYMKPSKVKPSVSDFKWHKIGYSPLSGKTYRVK